MNTSTSATNHSLPDNLSFLPLITTASYAINTILGLPTNVYVLWLLVSRSEGVASSEIFVLNHTIAEIIFCLSSIVLFVCQRFPTTVLIHVVKFCVGFLFTARPLFQCCICVERYLAVVHPVVYLKCKPSRYRVGCCGVVWSMVLGSCSFFGFDLGDSPHIYYVYFGQFLALLLVILFCCLSVLMVLKRPGPGGGVGEKEGKHDRKMRAFRIILIILVSMVINYLPIVIIFLCNEVMNPSHFLVALYIILFVIVMCGFVQPVLYLHRAGKLPFITAT
ncbi:hypothetical protein DPEC_G00184640 [Dallia pectoralis]|uniref:Uncharacterized protein n=1 Tax=Dallia pectoralis TaxID=75939 RepID=A0ACC2GB95_DALPE|nr:hypothetical protein DPEC_G00184640 [Dallia pectoralis]